MTEYYRIAVAKELADGLFAGLKIGKLKAIGLDQIQPVVRHRAFIHKLDALDALETERLLEETTRQVVLKAM